MPGADAKFDETTTGGENLFVLTGARAGEGATVVVAVEVLVGDTEDID